MAAAAAAATIAAANLRTFWVVVVKRTTGNASSIYPGDAARSAIKSLVNTSASKLMSVSFLRYA